MPVVTLTRSESLGLELYRYFTKAGSASFQTANKSHYDLFRVIRNDLTLFKPEAVRNSPTQVSALSSLRRLP